MAADLAQLRNLLKHLQNALGRDRDLDLAIEQFIAQDGDSITVYSSLTGEVFFAPDYTSSIDTAVALVAKKLPECGFDLRKLSSEYFARLTPLGLAKVDPCATAPTAPLAILSALCSALIAEMEALDA